jgi:hypothetical protein
MEARRPEDVIPAPLALAVGDLPYWFLIGGHAVRCTCPYRPSRDVDFGVPGPAEMADFLRRLETAGRVEVMERGPNTVHLRFEGLNVSVFVLDRLLPFVADRRLTVTGILATKLNAILDRGFRRDFFDLYVMLERHSLGIAECLAAMRRVYGPELNEPLLLRALTFFDDADREAALPGEGPKDWDSVRRYFLSRVGNLLVPPKAELEIQKRVVDAR